MATHLFRADRVEESLWFAYSSFMNLIHRHRTALVAVQVLVLVSVFHSALAANTWDGGGANDDWGTAANWDDNSVPGFPAALTFAGTNRLTPNNNLSSVTVNGLTFDAAAGAFTLGGDHQQPRLLHRLECHAVGL